MEADRSLELSSDEMRRLVDRAMDHILTHLETLAEQPASNIEAGGELARGLKESLPEKGLSSETIFDLLFNEVIPQSLNTASPGYLAYIPGGGLFHSAVADLIANAVNRYVGVWIAAPGLVQLEKNVLRWFCDLVGYSSHAGGVLTSGGSLANLIALITARRECLPENFLKGTIYTSDQTHHSVQKAAILAGFPVSNVRKIPSDSNFRIELKELTKRIHEDRKNGAMPFLIVGNAGTTNTGAVDDLESLAKVARVEKLWFHVDAAYGGFFMLTETGRKQMRGIEHADSIVLDPHKGLFLPYGTGSLLVKDEETLLRCHRLSADYMPAMQPDRERVDFSSISPELSRDFRGLRVWLPLKLHGIEPFRRNLQEKLELTRWTTQELRNIPGVEIVAEPQLSVIAFRVMRPNLDLDETNQLNRQVLEHINVKRRVYLTSTLLGNRFVIRICVLSFRTHRERMEAALEDIRASIDDVMAER